jgi:hypothetical protein
MENTDISNNMIDISDNMIDISDNMIDISDNIMDISNNMIEHIVQNIFTGLLNEGQNSLFLNPPSNINNYIHNNIAYDNNNDNDNNDINDNNDSSNSLFHHIYQQYRNRTRAHNIVESSLYENPAYKQVIDDDVLEELIIKKFKETEQKNTKCPIYFTEFEDEDDVNELPCKHIFTPDGITKWLTEESNECPVCRYSFKSKEIKNEEEEEKESDIQSSSSSPPPPIHYHNPMQRYLIERILQSNNNIDEDDIEFQQTIMNSMNNENSDSN